MGAHGGRRGGAVAGIVTRTSRGTVPNRTVQYRTILCLTLQQEHTAKHILPCLSQRKPGGKKAAVGNRRKCGKLCGSVWETCFKALRPLRAGAGAAEHGAVPTGGMCGCGVGLRPGAVWRVPSAGAGVVDAFGWRVVAAVRCGTRVQRGARWLTFLLREKMLDKLCKSILNWKQGITQAAGDGLRHRPHRRSCSVYPTSTSSHVHPSHVHLIRRGDFGHVLCVRRAPFRRCPPQNGDEKLRPASNRCWAEFCDSSRAGAAAFLWAFRLPFRWLSCAAAFPQPFLCACGHRAAFLTRPSRSCPRATPRTGCTCGRSGGRTPSSPATTAGRTR